MDSGDGGPVIRNSRDLLVAARTTPQALHLRLLLLRPSLAISRDAFPSDLRCSKTHSLKQRSCVLCVSCRHLSACNYDQVCESFCSFRACCLYRISGETLLGSSIFGCQ